ncbi:MAG: phosphatidylglycerol lysyltransferase domain-containing protein [Desulfobacteraceae bacterium]|jgi:hypothetical protein|nr:phosphatidylglycerol lysyltransferase domain-containing protein [Desulfobacteraceae bacterium]
MPLSFSEINLEQQHAYRTRLASCEQKASDYSFVNLWSWSGVHELSWAWEEDLVWVRQRSPREQLWAPVGRWEGVDWHSRLSGFEPGTTFARVPLRLLQRWEAELGDRLSVEESRGQWDYLYTVDDLVRLSGNRLHKKKNLVRQFLRNYAYTYRPMSGGIVERARELQEDWCTWRDCESHEALTAENKAIERVLASWDSIHGLLGGALIVEEKMVAYTVAERLNAATMLIHFEKADPEYKGAYQAINQMFLEAEAEGVDRVNREQDLDDPGLRKAKTSYQPVDFLKKYAVTLL